MLAGEVVNIIGLIDPAPLDAEAKPFSPRHAAILGQRAYLLTVLALQGAQIASCLSAISEQLRAGALSCNSSQPSEIARSSPAVYSVRCSLVAEQEGVVDLLDIDSAILDRFEGSGVFQNAPRGLVRVDEGSVCSQFQNLSLTFSKAW